MFQPARLAQLVQRLC